MKVVINGCYGVFSLSPKAKDILTMILGAEECYNLELYENRNNHILVALVESMGKDASGGNSRLVIEEIEDGLSWDINEYDGLESVHTYLGVSIEELQRGVSEEKLRLLKHTYNNEIRVI